MNPRSRAHAGFTLIELLVSISLAGVVALLIHQVLGASLGVGQRARDELAAVRTQAAIRDRLSGWIRQSRVSIAPETYAAFHGADQGSESQPNDSLALFTLSAAPVGAGPAQISIFINRTPGTAERGLVVNVRSVGSASAARTVQLVPEATGLDARFLFRIGREARWFRGWDSASSLPIAVELRILGEEVPQLLRVPLTIPIGWSG